MKRCCAALFTLVCTTLPAVALAAPEAPVEPEADASIEVAAPGEAEPAAGADAGEATATEAPTTETPALDASEPELSAEEIAAIEALVAEQIEDEYDAYPYYEDEVYEDSTYEPPRTTLELQSGYIGLGIAPGMTIHDRGFHPNTRFELEFGGTLEHEFRDLGWSFGVVSHVTPYYGRKKPSFGADVTSTAMLGPVYVRTGLGALGALPRNHNVDNIAPAIGGVVGVGLNFGRAPMVRIGVDYDFRVTTKLEPIHTVFIALRVACCRSE